MRHKSFFSIIIRRSSDVSSSVILVAYALKSVFLESMENFSIDAILETSLLAIDGPSCWWW